MITKKQDGRTDSEREREREGKETEFVIKKNILLKSEGNPLPLSLKTTINRFPYRSSAPKQASSLATGHFGLKNC